MCFNHKHIRNNAAMGVQMNSLCISAEAEPQKDPLLQLVSLQKAAGCWELNASLAAVFGKTEDEVTNQKAAQVGHMMSYPGQADDWLSVCV